VGHLGELSPDAQQAWLDLVEATAATAEGIGLSEHFLFVGVYVGGTASDEAAARIAGITHIHVSWGFGQPEGNPMIVNSFAELLVLLERHGPPDAGI
jgi:phosphoglycolate phosphatase-like HAD superfamily hydrolase